MPRAEKPTAFEPDAVKRKTERVTLVLSPTKLARLVALADQRGMDVSNYVTEMVEVILANNAKTFRILRSSETDATLHLPLSD